VAKCCLLGIHGATDLFSFGGVWVAGEWLALAVDECRLCHDYFTYCLQSFEGAGRHGLVLAGGGLALFDFFRSFMGGEYFDCSFGELQNFLIRDFSLS